MDDLTDSPSRNSKRVTKLVLPVDGKPWIKTHGGKTSPPCRIKKTII